MITPTLKLPFTQRNQIIELIEQSGYQITFDDSIKQCKDNKYHSFVCNNKSADIGGCIIESQDTSDCFHISFSPDIRKLWKFWTLPKQHRLISEICNILISNRAIQIEDD